MADNETTEAAGGDRQPRLAFMLPQADVDRLAQCAADKRVSVSAMIRMIICAELDRLDADD